MSDSSAGQDTKPDIKATSPDDDKTFIVCMISQNWDAAPVLGPKRVLDMSADGTADSVAWEGGRHLWFHCVRETAGMNEFASVLAGRALIGEVYIVMTEQDHSMADFPADIFGVITTTHARRPPTGRFASRDGGEGESEDEDEDEDEDGDGDGDEDEDEKGQEIERMR